MGNIDKKKVAIALAGVLVVVILLTLLVTFISGKGSKRVDYEQRLTESAKTILELQEQLANIDVGKQEVIGTTSLTEINGVKTFRRIDGSFLLPSRVEVPNSIADSSVSKIQVGGRFVFIPSESWVVSLNGSQVNLSHPNGIEGTLKALKVKDPLVELEMMDLVRGLFVEFPVSTLEFRKVFIDDRLAGVSGTCITEIDNKPTVVTMGYMNRSENALMFGFTYDSRANLKELVDLFMRSGTFGSNPIHWE